MKYSGFVCLVMMMLILTACLHPPFSRNYKDKKGHRQGRWIMYYDDTKKQLYYKGRYKNNRPVGTLKYYFPNGKLLLLEKYGKSNNIPTTYYHKNGKVELQGNAEMIIQKDTVIYNWIGQWQKYDSLGRHTEEHTYIHGKLIWVKKIQ